MDLLKYDSVVFSTATASQDANNKPIYVIEADTDQTSPRFSVSVNANFLLDIVPDSITGAGKAKIQRSVDGINFYDLVNGAGLTAEVTTDSTTPYFQITSQKGAYYRVVYTKETATAGTLYLIFREV